MLLMYAFNLFVPGFSKPRGVRTNNETMAALERPSTTSRHSYNRRMHRLAFAPSPLSRAKRRSFEFFAEREGCVKKQHACVLGR